MFPFYHEVTCIPPPSFLSEAESSLHFVPQTFATEQAPLFLSEAESSLHFVPQTFATEQAPLFLIPHSSFLFKKFSCSVYFIQPFLNERDGAFKGLLVVYSDYFFPVISICGYFIMAMISIFFQSSVR